MKVDRSTHFGFRICPQFHAAKGFTSIELIVVMGIIILVLAFGIPAFNRINLQSRKTSAVQVLNGVCTRAYAAAVANNSLTAVRLMPAAWDQDPSEGVGNAGDVSRLQKAITYRWTTAYEDPANQTGVGRVQNAVFNERFERMQDGPEALMPSDIWAAPIESLNADPNAPAWPALDGRISTPGAPNFVLDPSSNAGQTFFNADDYLVVFDPKVGVVPSTAKQAWPLKALDANPTSPTYRQEIPGTGWNGTGYATTFRRFNYTGFAIYRRETMTALGTAETISGSTRRGLLQRDAKTYFVNRTGGTLLAGNQ